MGLFQRVFGNVTNDADNAVADLNEALRLYKKGSFKEALAIGDRLTAAGPEVAMNWRFRGECLFSLQRYAEAAQSFERAAKLGGPGTTDVFLWQSLALHNGGKRDEAKALLRTVLAASGLAADLRAKTEAAL